MTSINTHAMRAMTTADRLADATRALRKASVTVPFDVSPVVQPHIVDAFVQLEAAAWELFKTMRGFDWPTPQAAEHFYATLREIIPVTRKGEIDR